MSEFQKIKRKTGPWFRLKEIIRSFFQVRNLRGGKSIAPIIFRTVLLLLVFYLIYNYLIPMIVAFAFSLKYKTFNSFFTDYMPIFTLGWENIVGLEDYKIVSDFLLLIFGLLGVLLWLYAFTQSKRKFKKGIFGQKASRSTETGSAPVEMSELALMTTSVTWNPNGKRPKYGGLVYGYSSIFHRYYLSGPEGNTYTEGPPGSNKSTECVIPTGHACIAATHASTVLMDPKPELRNALYHYAKKVSKKVFIFDFNRPKVSDLYNPLVLIFETFNKYYELWKAHTAASAQFLLEENNERAEREAMIADGHLRDAYAETEQLAMDAAEQFIPKKPGSSADSEFWKDAGQNLLKGLILLVCTYRKTDWVDQSRQAPAEPKREQQTMPTIQALLGKYGKVERVVDGKKSRDYIALEDIFRGLAETHPAVRAFNAAKNAPNQALSSTVMTLSTNLSKFVNESVNSITYDSSFTFEELASEKVTVFFTCPNNRPALSVYSGIFLTQMYQAFTRFAETTGGHLPMKVHVIYEEAGNAEPFVMLPRMCGEGRGFGLNVHLVAQGASQLNEKYGIEGTKAIMQAINHRNFLKVVDLSRAEEISKRIGKANFDDYQDTTSHQNFTLFDGNSSTRKVKARDDYFPPSAILDWNSSWGHIVWRDKFDRQQGLFARIFLKREKVSVAIYPTVKAKHLPTFSMLGIVGRKRMFANGQAINEFDKSATRVPPIVWLAKSMSPEELVSLEKELVIGGLGKKTKDQISSSVEIKAAQRAKKDTEKFIRKAAKPYVDNIINSWDEEMPFCEYSIDAQEELKKLLINEIKRTYETIRRLENKLGCEKPFSCDQKIQKAERKAVSDSFFKEVQLQLSKFEKTTG